MKAILIHLVWLLLICIMVVFQNLMAAKRNGFPEEPTKKNRIAYLENNATTYACNGKALEIVTSDAEFNITGHCSYLAIYGPNSKIRADSVHVLRVSGPDSKVIVNAVNHIGVTAPDPKA